MRKIKKSVAIEDYEGFKTIANPLRRRLLEIFAKEPLTTKQAALILGENPTKLYHHVAALENAGFIKLIETRQNRGTTEKYYQTAAREFVVKREMFEFEKNNELARLLTDALQETAKTLGDSLEKSLINPADEKIAASLISGKFFLNREKWMELSGIIQNWLKENTGECAADESLHQILMVVYPVVEE